MEERLQSVSALGSVGVLGVNPTLHSVYEDFPPQEKNTHTLSGWSAERKRTHYSHGVGTDTTQLRAEVCSLEDSRLCVHPYCKTKCVHASL